MTPTSRLITGDARTALRALPDASVQCVVTSPPYFGLRSYGVGIEDGEIGLEQTPREYVENVVQVFREVCRVLRDDGTLWLNLGDSYDNKGRLSGIPWRVALALCEDGWLLFSEVIWSKPKGAPSGGVRKPLRTHEQVFLLAKGQDYYYEADAIREPLAASTLDRYRYSVKSLRSRIEGTDGRKMLTPNEAGRHRRSVWTVTPTFARYDGDHFAVMPEKLVEPCILAGTKIGDLVLDPFAGSGTVGVVCQRYHRSFLGVELNHEYVKMAESRIAQTQPGLAL